MDSENNTNTSSNGNSVVMGIILVVALLIIGSLGAYAVINKQSLGSMINKTTQMQSQDNQKTANTPSPTTTPVAKPTTPEIKPVESSKDLDSIQNQLNKTDIEVGSSVNF